MGSEARYRSARSPSPSLLVALVLVLVLAFTWCRGADAVSCLNYAGAAAVERWVVYHLGPARGWWYWDNTLPGAPRYYITDPLTDVNNPVAHTINQVRTITGGAAPAPTVQYVHFGEADGADAGTLAVDTANSEGFFLTHSHSQFPVNVNGARNPFPALVFHNLATAYTCVSYMDNAPPAWKPSPRSPPAHYVTYLQQPDNAAVLPAIAGINWAPASLGTAIVQHLLIRNAMVRFSTVPGLAAGARAGAALHASGLLRPGMYITHFPGVPAGGAQFSLWSKSAGHAADVWVEHIGAAVGFAFGHSQFVVKTATSGGAARVRNPSQCCGDHNPTAVAVGAHCRANCMVHTAAHIKRVHPTGANAWLDATPFGCPRGSDVMNVDHWHLGVVVFDAASPPLTAAATAQAAGGAHLDARTTDNSKWAIGTATGGHDLMCFGDLNRAGDIPGGALGVGGGHNALGGGALCERIIPATPAARPFAAVRTALQQMVFSGFDCTAVGGAAWSPNPPTNAVYYS